MKKSILLIALTAALGAQAQLSVGSSESLTLAAGSTFSYDGLVFTPASLLTLSGNTVTKSATAVTGPGAAAGINRSYVLDAPINYTGTLQVHYKDDELNGNMEAGLEIYKRLATVWVTTGTGIVDPTLNYVEIALTDVQLNGVTAAQNGTILPLVRHSFTAILRNSAVELNWKVDNNEQYQGFQLQASADGHPWKNIASILAVSSSGTVSYSYTDRDILFTTKQYRLQLQDIDGRHSYSPVEVVSQQPKADMYAWTAGGKINMQFAGRAPKQVRVFNGAGQLVWQDDTAQSSYTTHMLKPGFYIVSYTSTSGMALSKKVVVP
ncbi:hypothetical protein [Agriterribacter sp.]|uniref:hypothetical protein n=1 Tax=Agriterribacter sp. TaxID=2821509 RepID=UPI002B7E73AD|nr:hypothetical protein [Agriterribacter sp.]HRP56272.1 hypothetical protein [Agriterribacter sp.]